MSRLTPIPAKTLIKIISDLGFILKRQHGSHMFFEHSDGRTTVIPNHPGEDLGIGLLNKIIKKDLDLTRDDFVKLLK